MNTRQKIVLIVAMTEEGIIGNSQNPGGMPWKWQDIPSDMEQFVELTMGHPVVMGRKTAQYFKKPLSGRRNIVLSRNKDCILPVGFEVMSFEELCELRTKNEIYGIGGKEIYDLLIPHAQEMRVTVVHAKISGDVMFTKPNANEWKFISLDYPPKDAENIYPLTFYHLKRN